MIDIKELVSLLGVKGTIAGLTESSLTIPKISSLFAKKPNSRMKRDEVIKWIVSSARNELLNLNPEDLMKMDKDSLIEYFESINISKDELNELLVSDFKIIPNNNDLKTRNNLIAFAAREISDTGMYKRVSEGK